MFQHICKINQLPRYFRRKKKNLKTTFCETPIETCILQAINWEKGKRQEEALLLFAPFICIPRCLTTNMYLSANLVISKEINIKNAIYKWLFSSSIENFLKTQITGPY